MPCGKKGNKTQVQKVVIPKGMINPGETTIIEIPSNLQRQPIVVAKRKSQNEFDNSSYASASGHGHGHGHHHGLGHGHGHGHNRSDMSNGSRHSNSNKKSQAELEQTERREREQFLRDLEEFQKARRKLIANASFLANKDSMMGNGRR